MRDMQSAKTPIERAIDVCGNQQALAAMIGRSQQLVSYWKSKGIIPAEVVPAIEAATGIPRQELRPDVFGLSGAPQ